MSGTPAQRPRGQLGERLRFVTSRWPVILHDAVMIAIAWGLAYWLRYNLGSIPDNLAAGALRYLPVAVLVHLGAGMLFGVHRTAWRFVSATDFPRLVKAIVVGTIALAGVLFFFDRMAFLPRSALVLHAVLLLVLLGGSRIVYRLINDRDGTAAGSGQRVLLVGAGQAGEMLVRDMRRGRDRPYLPVGIVDDDAGKHGRDVHGVRIVGGTGDIARVAAELDVSRIIIATPSATAAQMQKMMAQCEAAGVPVRTLPKVMDVVDGTVDTSDLRQVQIEDLLGRDPVSLDWSAIGEGLSEKRVVVTGAGGSIGSELCRQLARLGVAELTLFERNEFNLYQLQTELEDAGIKVPVGYVLGDVCDTVAVRHLFDSVRPDMVFHAAAYKHVPLLEDQIRESVRNNVIGTRIVADEAVKAGVERFVLISTDKAVNPSSCMGACKRAAEIYCAAKAASSQTRFITVRFGNVLGSAGSVVPRFREQINGGGPVTVTHPDVTRYFMTIAEACQLILQASSVGKGGEIYVLDMGEPISIVYLAEQMITLSGREPGHDIDIVFTGLRPGEKIVERLFHEDEPIEDTGYPKLMLAPGRTVDAGAAGATIDQMAAACERFDHDALERLVRVLVPEYETPIHTDSSAAAQA